MSEDFDILIMLGGFRGSRPVCFFSRVLWYSTREKVIEDIRSHSEVLRRPAVYKAIKVYGTGENEGFSLNFVAEISRIEPRTS